MFQFRSTEFGFETETTARRQAYEHQFQFRSTEFGFETKVDRLICSPLILFQFRSTEFGFETDRRPGRIGRHVRSFNSVLRNLVLRQRDHRT